MPIDIGKVKVSGELDRTKSKRIVTLGIKLEWIKTWVEGESVQSFVRGKERKRVVAGRE